ncbi:MAG: hypothetical protein SO130_06730 [Agathobacter sp.]|nr:hypothetical protein [Agathobacter sp.]
MKENQAVTNGTCFVKELKSGQFQKNYRPNHGPEFSSGLKDLYLDNFKEYMSSCSCFLMDQRLKREEYHG